MLGDAHSAAQRVSNPRKPYTHRSASSSGGGLVRVRVWVRFMGRGRGG